MKRIALFTLIGSFVVLAGCFLFPQLEPATFLITLTDTQGLPVVHGSVQVVGSSHRQQEHRTNAQGQVRLQNEPGTWMIRAQDGVFLLEKQVTLRKGQPVELILQDPRAPGVMGIVQRATPQGVVSYFTGDPSILVGRILWENPPEPLNKISAFLPVPSAAERAQALWIWAPQVSDQTWLQVHPTTRIIAAESFDPQGQSLYKVGTFPEDTLTQEISIRGPYPIDALRKVGDLCEDRQSIPGYDGKINVWDLIFLLQRYGRSDADALHADIGTRGSNVTLPPRAPFSTNIDQPGQGKDGVVDVWDLILLLKAYGATIDLINTPLAPQEVVFNRNGNQVHIQWGDPHPDDVHNSFVVFATDEDPHAHIPEISQRIGQAEKDAREITVTTEKSFLLLYAHNPQGEGYFSRPAIEAAKDLILLLSPPDGAQNQPTTVTLTWEASPAQAAVNPRSGGVTITGYDVYFAPDGQAYGAPQRVTAKSLQKTGLQNNTTYKWKVEMIQSDGKTFMSQEWRFSTAESESLIPFEEIRMSPFTSGGIMYSSGQDNQLVEGLFIHVLTSDELYGYLRITQVSPSQVSFDYLLFDSSGTIMIVNSATLLIDEVYDLDKDGIPDIKWQGTEALMPARSIEPRFLRFAGRFFLTFLYDQDTSVGCFFYANMKNNIHVELYHPEKGIAIVSAYLLELYEKITPTETMVAYKRTTDFPLLYRGDVIVDDKTFMLRKLTKDAEYAADFVLITSEPADIDDVFDHLEMRIEFLEEDLETNSFNSIMRNERKTWGFDFRGRRVFDVGKLAGSNEDDKIVLSGELDISFQVGSGIGIDISLARRKLDAYTYGKIAFNLDYDITVIAQAADSKIIYLPFPRITGTFWIWFIPIEVYLEHEMKYTYDAVAELNINGGLGLGGEVRMGFDTSRRPTYLYVEGNASAEFDAAYTFDATAKGKISYRPLVGFNILYLGGPYVGICPALVGNAEITSSGGTEEGMGDSTFELSLDLVTDFVLGIKTSRLLERLGVEPQREEIEMPLDRFKFNLLSVDGSIPAQPTGFVQTGKDSDTLHFQWNDRSEHAHGYRIRNITDGSDKDVDKGGTGSIAIQEGTESAEFLVQAFSNCEAKVLGKTKEWRMYSLPSNKLVASTSDRPQFAFSADDVHDSIMVINKLLFFQQQFNYDRIISRTSAKIQPMMNSDRLEAVLYRVYALNTSDFGLKLETDERNVVTSFTANEMWQKLPSRSTIHSHEKVVKIFDYNTQHKNQFEQRIDIDIQHPYNLLILDLAASYRDKDGQTKELTRRYYKFVHQPISEVSGEVRILDDSGSHSRTSRFKPMDHTIRYFPVDQTIAEATEIEHHGISRFVAKIPAGKWHLLAQKDGYYTDGRKFEIADDMPTDLGELILARKGASEFSIGYFDPEDWVFDAERGTLREAKADGDYLILDLGSLPYENNTFYGMSLAMLRNKIELDLENHSYEIQMRIKADNQGRDDNHQAVHLIINPPDTQSGSDFWDDPIEHAGGQVGYRLRESLHSLTYFFGSAPSNNALFLARTMPRPAGYATVFGGGEMLLQERPDPAYTDEWQNIVIELHQTGIRVFAGQETEHLFDPELGYMFDHEVPYDLGFIESIALAFGEHHIGSGSNAGSIITVDRISVRKIDKGTIVGPVNPGEMVRVNRGTFQMGDEVGDLWSNTRPVHTVTLTYDYWIGKYEVTFAEYDAFCEATGRSKPSDFGWGRGTRPVINVTWWDAIAYCNWLSDQNGLAKAYDSNGNLLDRNGQITTDITQVEGYRLPTEAEWEYAASGGHRALPIPPRYLYAGSDNIDEVAWYGGNSNADGTRRKTQPVGGKQANPLGLHDMSGNVWERCHDWYGSYTDTNKTNPIGPSTGSNRVLRGGSWGSSAANCRVAYRIGSSPGYSSSGRGFRIARTHF